MPEWLIEYGTALYARIWPALVGAVIALYYHPADASRSDRLFSAIASIGVSVLFGPALIDYYEVDSEAIARMIHGALALFGLTVIGQAFTSLRELGLAATLREAVRRRLGLKD